MRIKLKKILIMLTLIVFTPVTMAHDGVHGTQGFVVALIHKLSAVDHWFIFFLMSLFVGLFISTVYRSIVKT